MYRHDFFAEQNRSLIDHIRLSNLFSFARSLQRLIQKYCLTMRYRERIIFSAASIQLVKPMLPVYRENSLIKKFSIPGIYNIITYSGRIGEL